MSYKARLYRFTRTASIMDLRTDALAQEVERIRRKALSHMMRTKAFGLAVYS